MASLTEEDVVAYEALMTGPRNPNPTEEERAAEQAKAVERKAFLTVLAEKTSKSMGKLEKELGKLVKKRNAAAGGGKPKKPSKVCLCLSMLGKCDFHSIFRPILREI
jgi:formiminotetrahydrofolate cyclodeaminase